jgi:hypothetical protein
MYYSYHYGRVRERNGGRDMRYALLIAVILLAAFAPVENPRAQGPDGFQVYDRNGRQVGELIGLENVESVVQSVLGTSLNQLAIIRFSENGENLLVYLRIVLPLTNEERELPYYVRSYLTGSVESGVVFEGDLCQGKPWFPADSITLPPVNLPVLRPQTVIAPIDRKGSASRALYIIEFPAEMPDRKDIQHRRVQSFFNPKDGSCNNIQRDFRVLPLVRTGIDLTGVEGPFEIR